MNSRDYAQLLYNILRDKSEDAHTEILSRFVSLLTRNRIIHLKDSILREFKKIELEDANQGIIYVSSASELTDANKSELESIFPGSKNFSINKSLLGGVAVRVGDILYNCTIRKRIETLRLLL